MLAALLTNLDAAQPTPVGRRGGKARLPFIRGGDVVFVRARKLVQAQPRVFGIVSVVNPIQVFANLMQADSLIDSKATVSEELADILLII